MGESAPAIPLAVVSPQRPGQSVQRWAAGGGKGINAGPQTFTGLVGTVLGQLPVVAVSRLRPHPTLPLLLLSTEPAVFGSE